MAYGYDDAHQLVSVSAARPSDAARYRYDAAGNPVDRAELGLDVTNTFNNLNQIVTDRALPLRLVVHAKPVLSPEAWSGRGREDVSHQRGAQGITSGNLWEDRPEHGKRAWKKAQKETLEPLHQLAEVEADGGQQGVKGVACGAGKPATAFA